MDAAEDDKDIRLQRESGELLEDFEKSLHPFLYNVTNNGRLRRRVRIRETERLTALLDNFQELPQLLDRHLQRLVPTLANAFLTSISKPPSKSSTAHPHFLMPLRRAICQLLYTFCKVRGEKIIVQCLSPEPKHIDLLLSAIEKGTFIDEDDVEESINEVWGWEERYITLLWLSHLIIAPFDLDSLSSNSLPSNSLPSGNDSFVSGLKLPANIPDVPLRSVSLAFKYLPSSGKEKESAKTLLVKVSLRRDMQDLGLLHSLVLWSISALQSIEVKRNIHYVNGVLSFLSGILGSSMDTAFMDPYLELIFRAIQDIMESSDDLCAEIQNSAVSRKLTIKIFRSITLLNLRPSFETIDDILNDSVDFILEMLSNPSTPVRLAASKALSVIILKIQPEHAFQLVSVILDILTDAKVDAFAWHGHILTLSHLLYRHSAPRDLLEKVIAFILKALSYERKSISGSSIGTNVRDAANFGIWALARRYSTAELQDIRIESEEFAHPSETNTTIQILATHLVVSACLDSAGNIRRGSSAALQELIGRHPNTIIEALELVQIVDYHAVALRSRGILEVALSASLLSYNTYDNEYRHHYGEALLEALRGWRGVGDTNIVTRRNCAEAFRQINFLPEVNDRSNTYKDSYYTICVLDQQLKGLQKRQANERHGLLLFLSAAILEYPELQVDGKKSLAPSSPDLISKSSRIIEIVNPYIERMTDKQDYYRSELIGEALYCVVFHSLRLFGLSAMFKFHGEYPSMADDVFTWLYHSKTKDVLMFKYEEPHAEHMIFEVSGGTFETTTANDIRNHALVALFNEGKNSNSIQHQFWELALSFVCSFLDINSEDVDLWSACTRRLFFWSPNDQRKLMINSWLEFIRRLAYKSAVEIKRERLIFSAVWIAYSLDSGYREEISVAIHDRWKSTGMHYNIDTRIALVSCLAIETKALSSQIIEFWDIISDGLDDYHTDKVQGDIGSRVRLKAIKGAAILLSDPEFTKDPANNEIFSIIFGKLLRLYTERLDRVRTEAKKALLSIITPSPETTSFAQGSVSSYSHFKFILDLQTTVRLTSPTPGFEWNSSWTEKLLEGYVTSAHGGSEDLIRVSRASLIDFCEEDVRNREVIGSALIKNLESHHRKNDRVVIPTLEIVALLLDTELIHQSLSTDEYKKLYTLTAKEAFKSIEISKLLAVAKCYGQLARVYPEAINRLIMMLWHHYPMVRVAAVDELWDLGVECVKGRDWGIGGGVVAGGKKGVVVNRKTVLGVEGNAGDGEGISEFARVLVRECRERGFVGGEVLGKLGG